MTAAARRQQLIEAAAQAIVDHGVGALRVRDVAEAAGVSQPLVSAHFRSRDELVLAAFVHTDEQALAALEARSREAPDARAALRSELVACLDAGGDPLIARSFRVWQEVLRHGFTVPELRQAVNDRQNVWIERIRDLLAGAVADGSARADLNIPLTALSLSALVDGLSPAIRWGSLDVDTASVVIDDAIAHLLDPRA